MSQALSTTTQLTLMAQQEEQKKSAQIRMAMFCQRGHILLERRLNQEMLECIRRYMPTCGLWALNVA